MLNNVFKVSINFQHTFIVKKNEIFQLQHCLEKCKLKKKIILCMAGSRGWSHKYEWHLKRIYNQAKQQKQELYSASQKKENP